MTTWQYYVKLHELKVAAGMSLRYHKHCEEWYGWWDKAIRITVAVLAAIGLILAIRDYFPIGIIVAVISLVATMVLNIVPVGDKEKQHAELYQLWNELFKDCSMEQIRISERGDSEEAPRDAIGRIAELERFLVLKGSVLKKRPRRWGGSRLGDKSLRSFSEMQLSLTRQFLRPNSPTLPTPRLRGNG
jgi:hypothetical protein